MIIGTTMSEMRAAVVAGVAVYNAGEHHAAHDAWEAEWLALDAGTDDERFLHGLIQFTAAVYHGRRRNWSGARKLARSAREYLDGLGPAYRGVDLASVRAYLRRLAADPEYAERARPPPLRYRGRTLSASALDLDAVAVAAEVIAEEYGLDEEVVERAVAYARTEEGTARSRFRTLLCDLVEERDRRELVYGRLRDHVRRRRREETDVEGLFD
jgi:predicted metal-dependent hydrolase